MGLLDKLTTAGTPYSYNNGATPITNPGATKLSKLHVDGNQPSYSINGANFTDVNTAFQAYNDGFINSLPQPSQLDINGAIPTGPLSDPSVSSINNSFSQGQYINNFPG